jgi:hypothetical protein
VGDKETGDKVVLGICQRCRRVITGAVCMTCVAVTSFVADTPHTHQEGAPPLEPQRVLAVASASAPTPSFGWTRPFWPPLSSS